MTKEELCRAMAMMNVAPQPSHETRLGWLEADASAQRTATLKLERAYKLCCKALWALWLLGAVLAWVVLT